MSREIKTIPRLKVILGLFRFLKNPIPLIDEALIEYGDTYITYLGATTKSFMSVDPDFTQHILQKNNKNYHKSKLQTKAVGKYVGQGLLTTNGAYWLKQRRLIQPGFKKDKIVKLMSLMYEVVEEYVGELKIRLENGPQEIEITEEMSLLTLRIISKALFSTGIEGEQLELLNKAVTDLQSAIIKNVRQPMFGWWRKLTGEDARNDKLSQQTYDLITKLIEDRRKDAGEYNDLLDMLLHSVYEDTGEGMTTKQILDEALIIFVAGHETTANALSWTLYLLDQHPDIAKKLQAESEAVELDGPISYADIAKMEYNRQILSESMRLYPPAWITDRVALEDDVANGVKINKGDVIGLYIYGTHHSPKLWDDPEKFDPSRFERDKMKTYHPYAYYPFGGGPRLCIGQQFAMVEMQLSLMELVKNFNFKLKEGHPIELSPLVTLRPAHGLKMVVSNKDEMH